MRRALAVMVVAALLSTVGAATASAGTRRQSQFFYGSWRSHHRVDADTVDREYWYIDAYSSGNTAYGSVYHTIYRCTEVDGKMRCRRHFSEDGRVRTLTHDQFTIDKRLTSMHFSSTVTLKSKDGARTAAVTVDLTGTGVMTRSKESYSYRQGCELYKFSGHSRYRDAEGEPTITIDGADQVIGNQRYANIGIGDSVSIVKEC